MKDVNRGTHRILILGGGFGGITAALRLEKIFAGEENVQITLLNRDNYLLFTPMLPEVAGSGIEAKHIIAPIRAFFKKARFRDGEVTSIDLHNRVVAARHCPKCVGYSYEFDHLVLALGSVTSPMGLAWVKEHAFSFKTLADAMTLRNHVIDVLEHADMEPDQEMRRKMLTIVVVGAGLAGVELIAELNDFLRRAKRFYPSIRPEDVTLMLVERGTRIMPGIAEDLAAYAQKCLVKSGIEVRLQTSIINATDEGADLEDGAHIPTKTLVWTAGVGPNPLLAELPCLKEKGRVVADENLELPDYPGVWAVGDSAYAHDPKTGRPYPPTAQYAVKQGKMAAENIAAAINGRPGKPFVFSSIGQFVPLGRRTAIAEISGFKFRGFLAWWLWRTIYLNKLPKLERKIRVALDWTLDLFFPRDIVLLKTMLKNNKKETDKQS